MIEFIHSTGFWAPFVFILIYSFVPVLFIPATVFTIIGGFLFGPFWGTVYSLIGNTIGASLAFIVARYFAHDWVEKKAQGMLKKIKKGVEANGWRFVAFTRLLPVFPYSVLNHAFGLTKIPLRTFCLTSMICLIPGTIAYSYIGYVGQEAAQGSKDIFIKVSVALALLLLLSFVPQVFRKRNI